MITLYTFKSSWGVLCPSPFCMKAELYMRYLKIPYKVDLNADIRKSPRGKFPYIQTKEGTLLSDSQNIIEHINKNYNVDMDSHLIESEKNISHFIRSMIEEDLYWALVYTRWAIDSNWKITKETFFSTLPPVLNFIIPYIIRNITIKSLKGQGTARRPEKEIVANGMKNLRILSEYIGDKKYVHGETISSIDIVLYSTLVNFIYPPHKSMIINYARENKILTEYVNRMNKIFEK
ncbi:MAG: glutathione S-transferase family protein [Candidatus Gracilibacteria bacterium]|nr:glutathione S-transferase family protein [Candidatus Gracilibacteria bacterium]